MGRPRKYATEEERLAAIRESQRKHYQANKEHYQQYYQANKEHKQQYNQQYYQANKEHSTQYKQQYYQQYHSTLEYICANKSGSYRAKDRKRFGTDEGSVTSYQMKEMIETQPYCFYCGCEDITQLGLDRIDNSKPHTVDNCVVCCGKCNVERRKMLFSDFVALKSIDNIFNCADYEEE